MTQNLKRMIRTFKRSDLLITPRLESWLVQHPEGIVLDEEVASLIGDLAQSKPRYRGDTWAASSRGTCLRRQTFTFLGMPQDGRLDPRLQNLFNDGTWRHLRWQAMLLKAKLLTDVEVPVFLSRHNMVGTMDGENHRENFGFELKGIYSLSGVKDGPYPYHLLQVHSYFLAKPGLEKFSLIYEDKRTQDWKEYVVEPDQELLKEVSRELRTLNRQLNKRELPDVLEECRYGKGETFRSCPYQTRCLDILSFDSALQAGRGL